MEVFCITMIQRGERRHQVSIYFIYPIDRFIRFFITERNVRRASSIVCHQNGTERNIQTSTDMSCTDRYKANMTLSPSTSCNSSWLIRHVNSSSNLSSNLSCNFSCNLSCTCVDGEAITRCPTSRRNSLDDSLKIDPVNRASQHPTCEQTEEVTIEVEDRPESETIKLQMETDSMKTELMKTELINTELKKIGSNMLSLDGIEEEVVGELEPPSKKSCLTQSIVQKRGNNETSAIGLTDSIRRGIYSFSNLFSNVFHL